MEEDDNQKKNREGKYGEKWKERRNKQVRKEGETIRSHNPTKQQILTDTISNCTFSDHLFLFFIHSTSK